jgi:prolyl-tRNA synthetase
LVAKAPILTSHADDFPAWYQDVVAKAELAENGPVRGTMVIRPYGYAVWERMQAAMDERIKAAGAANVYFPLFIPESFLHKEAEHVEGFSPELAVVTHAGGKELDEPVVVRPTSETLFNTYFTKWIQSYRDLPLLLNQWANVVRWELRPRVFLRTTEFLWQEGHTAHATEADACDYAMKILHDVYEDFMVKVLAIPVHVGAKTRKERFAGATYTYCLEGMMGDGKALQMGTSHELGQNFARAFDTRFLDDQGAQQLVWTTSWGTSTRMVGGLIMAHGDDSGLRVPPSLAPHQVVVLLIRDEAETTAAAEQLTRELRDAGIRVELDNKVSASFGRRVTDWEIKGVPLRVEVGPRDVANGVVTVARRDTGAKYTVALGDFAAQAVELLADIQTTIFDQALERRDARTVDVKSVADAVEAAAAGFARMPWDVLGEEGETELNRQAVSVRCLQRADGQVPRSQDEPDLVAIVARSY